MLFPEDVRIPISRTAGVLTARARETAGVAAFMGGAPYSVHQEPLQATARHRLLTKGGRRQQLDKIRWQKPIGVMWSLAPFSQPSHTTKNAGGFSNLVSSKNKLDLRTPKGRQLGNTLLFQAFQTSNLRERKTNLCCWEPSTVRWFFSEQQEETSTDPTKGRAFSSDIRASPPVTPTWSLAGGEP